MSYFDMATTVHTGPDPYSNTRASFTAHHLLTQCPSNADPAYKHVFHLHQTLLQLLISHPAMDENRDQKYTTQAASKNKVYFMWDFISRSFGMLAEVDPKRPLGKTWTDVLMRALVSKNLILDTTGKLEAMDRATGYNEDAGIEFTAEIKAEAEKLDDLPAQKL